VLFTTSLRFAATGLYQLTEAGGWKATAGVIGLVLCALAVYAALALALEDARRETLLPVGRRTPRQDGLPSLEREAGVREQL
jgi:succinate-acetate transporter protein